MTRQTDAWKDEATVRMYLEGIRGAIPLAAEQIDVMLRLIDMAGGQPGCFLDIGCGGGALSLALLDRYPSAHVTLVDYSEPMLAEARERLSSLGDQCAIIAADLSSGAWQRDVVPRSPFDAIVSGFAIHHLTDERKQELYAEVFGLLRPGAFFINIEHVSSGTPWLVEVFDDVMIESLYAHQQSIGSGKTRTEVADEYVYRPDRKDNILASVEHQCEWLRDIGYQDVDCYLKLLELAVFGGRKPLT